MRATDLDDRECNCIAMHDFAGESVQWKEWFDYTLALFTKHGLEPMRLLVNGENYGDSTKMITFRGGLRKLQKHNFIGIKTLSLTLMSNKDDYVSNFIIDAGIYPSGLGNNKLSYLSFCIDEQLEPFDKYLFNEIASNMQSFSRARCGYYYRRNLQYYAGMYILGGNSLCYPDEEDNRRCNIWKRKWYSGESYRTGQLRDIYKLNFLSREHMDWPVDERHTLELWIKADTSRGELKELSPGFWSWYVPEERTEQIRQMLIPCGIIVCV